MPLSDTTGATGPEAASGPLIRFEKVVKRYGDNVVLRELDFEVAAGERVTLIGPSGSGKTTTTRLLLGILTPTSGTVEVFGMPPHTFTSA